MLTRAHAFFAVLLCAATTAQTPGGPNSPSAVVWPTSNGGNGHAYEVVAVPSGVTWFEASAAAVAAGGYLATPTTAAENAHIFGLVDFPQYWSSYLGYGQGPWIGAFLDLAYLGYRFVTTEPFSFATAPWAPLQPDFFGGADRLHYLSPAPGLRSSQWDDAVATDPIIAYVVEYDLALPCSVPPAGVFELCVAFDATRAAGRVQLFNAPVGAPSGRVLFSAVPAPLLGAGSLFGLVPDALMLAILFTPPTTGSPLSWIPGDDGEFPMQPFFFPPGSLATLAGMTLDGVGAVVDTAGTLFLSNFVRQTF